MTDRDTPPARTVRVSPFLGAASLALAVATLYLVRYHVPAWPLLHSLLMPAAAMALCVGAVSILVPVTTGHAWRLRRPSSDTPWRLRVLSGLALLWATFAAPAFLPSQSPWPLKLSVAALSMALLFAAAFQLAQALSPLLTPTAGTRSPPGHS